MSTPVSPVDQKLPHRSTTVNSTTTASTVSDDEAVFGDNTSEVCRTSTMSVRVRSLTIRSLFRQRDSCSSACRRGSTCVVI